MLDNTLKDVAAVLEPGLRDSLWSHLQKDTSRLDESSEPPLQSAGILPPRPAQGDKVQEMRNGGHSEREPPMRQKCLVPLEVSSDPTLEPPDDGLFTDVSLYNADAAERSISPKLDASYLQSIWDSVSDHDDHADKLVAHYFDVICQVMSCFDSASNPYRTDIPQSLSVSPHIFDCLMTMSAAHMANYINEYTVATLRYQTKAMSSLQEEMASLALTELATATTSKTRYQLLLGTIIIGMTSV